MDSTPSSPRNPNPKRRRLIQQRDSVDDDEGISDDQSNNIDDIYSRTSPDLEENLSDDEAQQPMQTQDFTNPDGVVYTEDEEGEGEDLIEGAEDDYRRMDTLDQYDQQQLDDRQYIDLEFDERRRVEEELDRRDAREGRVAQVLDEDNEMERDDEHRRRVRRVESAFGDVDLEEDEIINLEQFDVPLREWIAADRPRNEIKRRFKQFLMSFTDKSGTKTYVRRINEMAQKNEQSLEIEIGDIIQSMSMIASWIVEFPRDMISILEEVAKKVVLQAFPAYEHIHEEIYIRILDLPGTEKLRDLRTGHLNFLIKVSGVVTRRTGVFPQLKMVKFNCQSCGEVLGPYSQTTDSEIKLTSCPRCNSKGPFSLNTEQTVYRNYQKITLQESPGTIPPGRVPRYKDIILLADLIDKARPGEEIDVTGIYCNIHDSGLNMRQGFPIFRTVIEANYVEKRHDMLTSHCLTEEDKKEILRLSRDPQIGVRIIDSIAPSIYGHKHVKTALAMAMFGGKAKHIKNSRVRGDINVLMVGDPGTAKSQFLKYVEKTAPRSVYSTGKGASAVGLTAGVHRDPITKEWTLEGGALVLADRGICMIDEFDKMNECDRTSIHEAMEQQSISISKAGIVTSLQARCSVIAAANPIGGRYNISRTFAENVDLTDPILQRFDVLCVLQDRVDPLEDERLANFVISSHMRHNPQNASSGELVINEDDQEENQEKEETENDVNKTHIIPQNLLKKYIMYARMHVNPIITNVDSGKIKKFYAALRRASQRTGAVPIAVRHIESLFRMAEAYSRMHLRDNVGEDDMNMAIRVMTESLCDAQKFSFRRQWRKQFRQYLTYQMDYNSLLLYLLQDLFKDAHAYERIRQERSGGEHSFNNLSVSCLALEAKAKSHNISSITDFYSSPDFHKHGFHLDETNKTIVKSFH